MKFLIKLKWYLQMDKKCPMCKNDFLIDRDQNIRLVLPPNIYYYGEVKVVGYVCVLCNLSYKKLSKIWIYKNKIYSLDQILKLANMKSFI